MASPFLTCRIPNTGLLVLYSLAQAPWRCHYITTLYYQTTAAKSASSQPLTSTLVWTRFTVCPSGFRNTKNNLWKPNTTALQWSTTTHCAGLTLLPFPYSSSDTQTWCMSSSHPAQHRSRWSRALKQVETCSGAPNTPSTHHSAPVSRLRLRVCPLCTVPLHRRLVQAQWGCPSAASQLRLLTHSCVCIQPQAERASMSIQVGAYVMHK